MRRAPVFTWLSGSATGVLLGLFGVQLVTSGITVGRVTPLSRPEVLSALQAAEVAAAPQVPEAPAPAPVPAPETETVSDSPLSDTVSQPAVRPPASPPPRPGATAVPAAVPGPAQPIAPPATSPPPTSPPPSPPAPPTTVAEPAEPAKPAKPAEPAAPAQPAEPDEKADDGDSGKRGNRGSDDRRNKTYESRTDTISSNGGTAAVRFENGRVTLLWARPNAGYSVKVVSDGPDVVDVRFRRDGKRTRILAYYKDGVPTHEVKDGTGDSDSWDGRWNWNGQRGFDWERWQGRSDD